MVEGARLESVCTVTPYRGFESLPLRHIRKGARPGPLSYVAEREIKIRTGPGTKPNRGHCGWRYARSRRGQRTSQAPGSTTEARSAGVAATEGSQSLRTAGLRSAMLPQAAPRRRGSLVTPRGAPGTFRVPPRSRMAPGPARRRSAACRGGRRRRRSGRGPLPPYANPSPLRTLLHARSAGRPAPEPSPVRRECCPAVARRSFRWSWQPGR